MGTPPTTATPQQIAAALEPTLKKLRRLSPVDQIITGQELNQALLDAQAAIAVIRRAAVRQLRSDGWTLEAIGNETGMTNQRVSQIEQGTDRKSKAGR